jgi:hypothetical protein
MRADTELLLNERMNPRFQNLQLEPDEQDVVDKVEKFGWMVMNSPA